MADKRFLELDVIRGIAALAVVLCHYTGHAARYFDFPWNFQVGKHGVQLFFCLSGFVIFWTLRRSKTTTDFVVSRVSRLYPTYWAALTLTAAYAILSGEALWIRAYIANATMLQSFIGMSDIDIVFWTLAVELLFYFWMGLVFRSGQLSNITRIAIIWLTLSAFQAWMPASLSRFLILPHVPYFIAGVMFYRLWEGAPRLECVALVLAAFIVTTIHDLSNAIVAAAAFTIFWFAVLGKLAWTVNRVTVWLGTISYALYVVHRNLGYEMLNALQFLPGALAIVLVIAAALAVASAITYWIEQPATRWLRRKYATRRRRLTVDETALHRDHQSTKAGHPGF